MRDPAQSNKLRLALKSVNLNTEATQDNIKKNKHSILVLQVPTSLLYLSFNKSYMEFL